MNVTWYSNIARMLSIVTAAGLFIIALSAVIRHSRRIIVDLPEDFDQPFDYKGPERRIYPRVKVGIGVRYKLCKKEEISVFQEGRTKDISEGGIFLESRDKMQVGDKLELKLRLPLTAHFIIVTGKVMWSKDAQKEQCYHCGISFVDIDPNDRKLIGKYIAEQQLKD